MITGQSVALGLPWCSSSSVSVSQTCLNIINVLHESVVSVKHKGLPPNLVHGQSFNDELQ